MYYMIYIYIYIIYIENFTSQDLMFFCTVFVNSSSLQISAIVVVLLTSVGPNGSLRNSSQNFRKDCAEKRTNSWLAKFPSEDHLPETLPGRSRELRVMTLGSKPRASMS